MIGYSPIMKLCNATCLISLIFCQAKQVTRSFSLFYGLCFQNIVKPPRYTAPAFPPTQLTASISLRYGWVTVQNHWITTLYRHLPIDNQAHSFTQNSVQYCTICTIGRISTIQLQYDVNTSLYPANLGVPGMGVCVVGDLLRKSFHTLTFLSSSLFSSSVGCFNTT